MEEGAHVEQLGAEGEVVPEAVVGAEEAAAVGVVVDQVVGEVADQFGGLAGQVAVRDGDAGGVGRSWAGRVRGPSSAALLGDLLDGSLDGSLVVMGPGSRRGEAGAVGGRGHAQEAAEGFVGADAGGAGGGGLAVGEEGLGGFQADGPT